MPAVNYDHSRNLHTVLGARTALTMLFGARPPESMLDVGCGHGTWLRAALDLGVRDIFGIDGAEIADGDFLFPQQFYRAYDLSGAWDLERRFDIAICLEVAEHLPPEAAPKLIGSLVKHADLIVFSAAVPGQSGQHHVNCQWPEYWQKMFNTHGYACSDTLRWVIWDIADIEPWYRQNMFQAKYSPSEAGKETRIPGAVHSEILPTIVLSAVAREKANFISMIERGEPGPFWYASLLYKAISAKLIRKLPASKR
ncbi:MAG: methyltransferase domain-containing protein [Stellaceae bacterium]